MRYGLMLLALLLLAPGVQSQNETAGQKPAETDRRLLAPGTLSGFSTGSKTEKRSEPDAGPPSVLAAPRVLRFHDEQRFPPREAFPQMGRTLGQGNPWEQGKPITADPRRPLTPPPQAPRGPVNPWQLDDELLSMPGIPGMDRSLPLTPMDPLLSPMPYAPLSRYGGVYPPGGFYPPGSGYPGASHPFGGLMPGYGGSRNPFPFTPMDWF